jgi:hypothetical protein
VLIVITTTSESLLRLSFPSIIHPLYMSYDAGFYSALVVEEASKLWFCQPSWGKIKLCSLVGWCLMKDNSFDRCAARAAAQLRR